VTTSKGAFPDPFYGGAYKPATLVDILRLRAQKDADRTAYTFLSEADTEEVSLTYAGLDELAHRVAALLQRLGAAGERVLLVYPPGIDYLAAFFGCLYAGAVAVPAYPPRLNQSLNRLQSITSDAQPKVALTQSTILSRVETLWPSTNAIQWIDTAKLVEGVEAGYQPPVLTGDDLAFLQYSSGSTGEPKGVMLSHENLMHNSKLLCFAFEYTAESMCVSWLPVYHDMGLIGGILQPLYGGFPCVLMSPVTFLQRPMRWLNAVSRYRATISGGPNFAYDLCVDKITKEQKATLDLSSWTVAFNGSEPIRKETLDRFAEAFEPCGFQRESFFPCYGLAESSLIVSGGVKGTAPFVKTLRPGALERNRVAEASSGEDSRPVIGCGRVLPEHRVVIVEPETFTHCSPNEIGEIWVSGKSVARGYWDHLLETDQTFNAYISGTGEGPFLRTGDLGFLSAGQLYVTGRLKDLIIIRGLNHYPQDIESTVQRCHPALRQNGGAAFSIDADGRERLVIVQELARKSHADIDEVMDAIRTVVAEKHELQVHAISLVKTDTIPKTTSGKIQRFVCRSKFLDGSLQNLAEWRGTAQLKTEVPAPEPVDTPQTPAEVQSWLASLLAAQLGIETSAIDLNQPLTWYGLDSLLAIELVHNIEATLSASIPMARLLQKVSIRELAAEITLASTSTSAPAPAEKIRQSDTVYPLSLGQQAMWFLHMLAPDSTAYNLASAVSIKAELDVPALQRSFQALVDRHASLRTTFSARHGQTVQRVNDDVEVHFNHEDASKLNAAALNDRLVEESHRPFDLENGPLLRVHLFSTAPEEHVLLLVVQHIIADFWSLGVLMRELGLLFAGERKGSPITMSASGWEYADQVSWQANMLSSSKGEELRLYWQKQLGGELPVLNLPTDRVRPAIQTYSGASHAFKLNAELTFTLKELSRRLGVTLYTTLLAAFQCLLNRYSGQEDILVGSLVAGRNSVETREVIGYFVNPVVLRADFSTNQTFESLIQDVHRTVVGALQHQDYPFPLLVELLQPERDLSRPPIFQVLFVFQKTHLLDDQGMAAFALGEAGARMKLGELALESLALEQRIAQFDLTLVMAETEATLGASLQYNTDLFDKSTIARIAGHFETLLEGAVANPTCSVSDLPLLTESEKRIILDLNDTQTDYEKELCIHEIFERRMENCPDACALVFGDMQITYRELNQRANQLAHCLMEFGAGPETPVGICVERSLEMVIGLLGILKAGAAYIPLDPSYPERRLRFMLEDTQAPVLVTQERLRGRFGHQGRRVICLDTEWDLLSCKNRSNPSSGVTPDNLAYVIYTSGSTGEPKGVMIDHRSVINFFTAMDQRIGCGSEDVLLAVTGISFDISVLELFWTLARGTRVVLLAEQSLDAKSIRAASAAEIKPIEFSLFYFANDDTSQSKDRYRLIFEGAKFADQHGFAAVWTPERHFHAFGGLYPNPSVMSAALAAITQHIKIRAGSVVLPLHNPIRVAEEWSLVDNISKGRVGIAFASGWHSDDFVFFPENFAVRKGVMFNGIEIIKKLWRGEPLETRGGAGNDLEVRIYPRPVQPDLPIWITAAGTPDTYVKAGEIGANVLTHLLGQTLNEVAEKIGLYREARARNGHDPRTGRVTLMLHTFIGDDKDAVREKVRLPFTNYLRTSIGLISNLARSLDLPFEVSAMSEKDMADLLAYAFNRYFETAALFGTPDSCQPMIERLNSIGVDEVACLIDFGVDVESALAALPRLNRLRQLSNNNQEVDDFSLPFQARRSQPTLMQCTASMMRMLTMNPEAMDSLKSLHTLLLGGEALPPALAIEVKERLPARLVNMYGPTETTIWSATHEVVGVDTSVPIGRPIANTQIYILDKNLQLVPFGIAGELHIGGDGLARGYFGRPDLSADRFIPNPFDCQPGERMYRTGDLARYLLDGTIEFLNRVDQQVKIRGFRIELEEIERTLCFHPAIREAVVLAREDAPGDKRLTAYIVTRQRIEPDQRELRSFLKERLPEYMVPSAFMTMNELPLTANGKIDRKSLPAPDVAYRNLNAEPVAPRTKKERVIAEIWQQVLKIDRAGVHDNFFDLGGHSLLMAQAHSLLQEKLSINVPLIKLLEHPTISSLAKFIGQESTTERPSLELGRDRAHKQRDALKAQRRSITRARKEVTS
jgi:natural product biosynthesis luciferase-like monooxygenase protein